MKIPLCDPYIGVSEKELICAALDTKWLTSGNYNKAFEDLFKEFLNVKYAISMNSATSALHLALLSNGIKGEVIVPSFTFSATINAIVLSGATPVFCDIDYDTCNIDIEKIEDLITSKTKAIMPVHFAGQPCEMDKIMEIANRYNLIVIEDSAETLGATFNGKQAGSFGDGCFSFFPTKIITTGEGGMLTTNNEKVFNRAKLLSAHGISKDKDSPWIRDCVDHGFNFRMSNLNAAMGCSQMNKLSRIIEKRIRVARFYDEMLDKEYFDIPYTHRLATHCYQMYCIKLNSYINRDDMIKYLNGCGIEASVHFYPPVHKQSISNRDLSLPVTEEVSNKIISLPIFPTMSFKQIDYVCTKCNEFARSL